MAVARRKTIKRRNPENFIPHGLPRTAYYLTLKDLSKFLTKNEIRNIENEIEDADFTYGDIDLSLVNLMSLLSRESFDKLLKVGFSEKQISSLYLAL